MNDLRDKLFQANLHIGYLETNASMFKIFIFILILGLCLITYAGVRLRRELDKAEEKGLLTYHKGQCVWSRPTDAQEKINKIKDILK